MSSTFSTLNIDLSGFQVQKQSLDTSGYNISNVNTNTEGYSRQQAVFSARSASSFTLTSSTAQTGNGTEVEKIARITANFINEQLNQEGQSSSYCDQMTEGITKIESIFDESSDSSLNDALSNFYDALQDLSNNHSDSASRQTIISRAEVVADSF